MEQTVKNDRKFIYIGLGIVSTIIVLSFTVYYLLSTDFQLPERETYVIPEWVKANAGWWSEGHITDSEFSNSLQWLFDHGFVEIKKCIGQCYDEESE